MKNLLFAFLLIFCGCGGALNVAPPPVVNSPTNPTPATLGIGVDYWPNIDAAADRFNPTWQRVMLWQDGDPDLSSIAQDIARLQAKGVKVMVTFGGDTYIGPEKNYAAYVQNVVNILGPYADAWELWNELDCKTDYQTWGVSALTLEVNTIKAAFPTALIVAPASCKITAYSQAYYTWLRSTPISFDAIAAHFNNCYDRPDYQLSDEVKQAAALGKPVWITEGAWFRVDYCTKLEKFPSGYSDAENLKRICAARATGLMSVWFVAEPYGYFEGADLEPMPSLECK